MESKRKSKVGYSESKAYRTSPPLLGRGGWGVRLLLLLLPLTSFAQEPPIGSQAKADSIEIRDQRATKKFQQAMDKWLITDFARVGLIVNTLVKTSPFMQYPAMNPELGAYLATFEQETGTTIILRAYIDILYFNPWVVAYRSSQKTRKTFEISKAKPAHAVIDIVYSPTGMKNKYEVAGYNITVRDSLRTPAFREIFSEADFTRMCDTLQAAMGKGPVQTIDSTGFNAAVIRALEALKGDTKTKPDAGYRVTFRKGDAEGYDACKYPALNNHYQRDAAGNPIPWLALDTKKSYTLKGRYQVADPAAAKETPLNMEAADLVSGAPSIQDTLMTQSLSPAGKALELTAKANYTRYNRFNKGVTTVAGQIALAAYEKLEMKLVLVYQKGDPLTFNLTDLKKYLDDVYGQAVVSWDVQAEAFDYSFPGEVAIGNSALSSYSSQMNTIIKAFRKSSNKIDGKTYYIFMVPSLSGDADGYMPMKGQFGFVKNSGDPAHTIAHELGHGAFRLWHTFSKENNIAAQGMTDNLMDYTKDKTRLYKHQWDLVHDPETMLMPFLVDEEEQKLYTLNDVKILLDTIKKANNSVLVNVPTIVRLQDIVDDINITDSASRLTPSLTKNDFLSSFTHEKSLQLVETLRTRSVGTLSNLPTDYNPIILANKVRVNVGGKNYKLTINGYSMTEKIYTTHIAEDKIGNESKLIFYNARRVAESDDSKEKDKDKAVYRLNTDSSDIKNIRKAFDIVVHDSVGLGKVGDLKKYLNIKGTFDLSGKPTTDDKGVLTLRLRRLYSNSYITIGELTVDGDASVKLLTVELRKGDNCASDNTNLPKIEKSRICAGTYTFTLNTQDDLGSPQHRYKSLRLNTYGTSTGGKRNGILIHTGWNYGFTEGCILTSSYNDIQNMVNNPQNYTNKVTGKIFDIHLDARYFLNSTRITFEKSQPNLINNQEISLTGFTGDTTYNNIFTIKILDNRNVIIDHPFNEKANYSKASFSADIRNSVIGINWNNSAPTTMALYEYVEKHVPNGIIKGKIVITENDERVNVPQNIISPNAIELFMKWVDFTQWINN